MNQAYEIFSKFYDRYIEDTVPDLHMHYAGLIDKMIEKFNLAIESVLDLTCGTGILMKKLIERGMIQIEGMDISGEMLEYAQKKGLTVYQQDIRSFRLEKKYDLILSFDSLGHITDSKDLKCVFRNVSEHLAEGGVFLCDGGTREKANRMIGQVFNYQSPAYDFSWKNGGANALVQVELDILEKQTGKKFTEHFELQGHDLEDVIDAAKGTGLKIIFATLEPLAKKNGSFIACFQKISSQKS